MFHLCALPIVLGEVEEERQQNDIEEEHRRHGDILQATFKDSYRNLTYKHLLGYRYNTLGVFLKS